MQDGQQSCTIQPLPLGIPPAEDSRAFLCFHFCFTKVTSIKRKHEVSQQLPYKVLPGCCKSLFHIPNAPGRQLNRELFFILACLVLEDPRLIPNFYLKALYFCGGLTPVRGQVPTKASLSLPTPAGRKKKNITKGSWVKNPSWSGGDHYQWPSQSKQTQLGEKLF